MEVIEVIENMEVMEEMEEIEDMAIEMEAIEGGKEFFTFSLFLIC